MQKTDTPMEHIKHAKDRHTDTMCTQTRHKDTHNKLTLPNAASQVLLLLLENPSLKAHLKTTRSLPLLPSERDAPWFHSSSLTRAGSFSVLLIFILPRWSCYFTCRRRSWESFHQKGRTRRAKQPRSLQPIRISKLYRCRRHPCSPQRPTP